MKRQREEKSSDRNNTQTDAWLVATARLAKRVRGVTDIWEEVSYLMFRRHVSVASAIVLVGGLIGSFHVAKPMAALFSAIAKFTP
ncbi:MAG: hypothetical protein K9G59_05470 [Caulobacter sp.]|nr:hypothetical protein [Caulobacter sp.]